MSSSGWTAPRRPAFCALQRGLRQAGGVLCMGVGLSLGLSAGQGTAATAAPPARTASTASTASTAAPVPADADWIYRIQPGDTLIALTESYLRPGRHWRDLQKLNRVRDPLRLPPGGALRMPLAWLSQEASVAQTIFVQGQVLLSRGSEAEQPLRVGAELRSGDRLRSTAQASASLRFVDGSRLLIPPLSELSLEQLLVYGRSAIPSVQLRLHRGGADSRVQPAGARLPHYEIRTPSVNLGVRGTEFRVQVDAPAAAASGPAAARVQVLSGRVGAGLGSSATSQGEQLLAAGRGLLADGQGGLRSAPLLPAPQLGDLASLQQRLPLRLAWPAQEGAQAYRAQVYTRGNFDQLWLDHSSASPAASWEGLPDGLYTLRLRAIDALGLEGLAADFDFQLKARPEPPFIQAPAAAARLYGDAVELRWTLNTEARAYRLQIATDADFRQPLLERSDLPGPDFRATLPPGSYHWRLAAQARSADGSVDNGPFGDAQRFELRPIPPSPAPAETELGDDSLQLRWRAEAGVARYELQWAQDEAFSQGVQNHASEQASISLPRPGPGSYFLRVRCVDVHGQAGPYGQTQRIELPYPRWLWLLPLLLLVP